MGSGIAQVFAQNGYDVILRDIEEELLESGFDSIEKSLQKFSDSGKIEDSPEKILDRIEGTTELEKVSEADLVIEAVTEDIDIKKGVYKELEEVCPERGIFASNTSALMITDLATATERPEKFIGMHWFNPPQLMKLVEIVRGAETSDQTFETIKELAEEMGKKPIEANDGPGFFTTRYIASYEAEAIRLFEQGVAGIKEIDEMCKLAFNWPMGPFKLMDHMGIDTILHILEYLHAEIGGIKYKPPITLKKLVKSGYLGKKPKSKGGFYEYFEVE